MGRIGALIQAHVSSPNKPLYISSEHVPKEVIEKEKAIFLEQSKDEASKKKPEIFEKIIMGKVNKRLSEICLLGQVYHIYISKYIHIYSISLYRYL